LKVQHYPLSGKLSCIHVSGDFHDAYNTIAIISPNHDKPALMDYMIIEENGTSEAFVGFMMYLIAKIFLHHHEFVVMDHHVRIQDMLWETIIDGCPLHILVLYLPIHSPELNLMELVFHILAFQIHSFWYRTAGPCNKADLHKGSHVMYNMSYALIV
jgi:hypothetical protein